MTTQSIIIGNPTGLHARPASGLVAVAKKFTTKVMLHCGGKKGSASSMLNLLSMGMKGGATVEISGEGDDEAMAVAAVAEYLETFRDQL